MKHFSFRAYVDGAYYNGHCAWAFVVVEDDKEVAKFASAMEDIPEGLSSQQNVAAEMASAMRAATWAKANDVQVVICYDYEGIEKWVTGEWRTKNPYTEQYRVYMQANDHVEGFEYVEAHSGQKWNEMADRMAHSAAKSAAHKA